ncbi:MAG: glycosyltransferase family 4 protein [Erythrobacter sp.]
MMKVAHLLDDFAMGGVTRALSLFEGPALSRLARSNVVPIAANALTAPRIDADCIVDHMALSWKRLVFFAQLRSRHPRARIVHVEHSYTRAFEQDHVPAKTRFRTMLKLAASLVDEIVCVSYAQRDWMAQTVGIPAGKLCVIYPWTDPADLFAIEPLAKGRNGPTRLLAYGRYAPVKNFAALIEAMRDVSPDMAELTIFGDGPDRPALETLAGDVPHVRVLGPSRSPSAYLAQCDAVIIPSKVEAFGLVATEARMAGRAIFVADVDGLPEQARHGGHVGPMAGAKDIAAAIRTAAESDLVAMGAIGRENVRGQSSEIVARWADLFERAAGERLAA